MRPHRSFTALAMLLAVAVPAAPGHAAVPADGKLDFTVMREGEPIGHHRLRFKPDGAGLQVDIETDVAVKILFVTAYRFEHAGHELWQDGKLVRLWSKTNDDGTAHELSVSGNGDKLDIHSDGAPDHTEPRMVPASLWNEDLLTGGTILNTLDGRGMAIAVQDLGPDKIRVRGQDRKARHYRITGDLERELWYDEQNVLVRVHFKGEDGSRIEYVLR
tara:strand:+ start:292 stop:942 length:651 start_codon:yes stop_codon:yes gene_type:complete